MRVHFSSTPDLILPKVAPAQQLDARRQSHLNRLAFVNMKKAILLSKPDLLLASTKSRPTKFRCTDLWSKRMKKQAIEVMWAGKDPRIQGFHWRTKVLKDWSPPSESEASLRLSQYLENVKRREHLPHKSVNADWRSGSVCDAQIQGCERLMTEVKDERKAIDIDLRKKRLMKKQWRSQESRDDDLKSFISDEIDQFRRRKISVPEADKKTAMKRIQKKLDSLGLSFYIERRRRLPL